MLELSLRNGRRIAAAAVIGMALSGVAAMAQESAPPPPAGQEQGAPPADGMGGPGMHGGRGMRGGGPERRLERMEKELNLSPDQVTQVKAIEADTRSQMQAMRGDSAASQDDRHAKMKSLQEATMTKIRAVLNDDQRTKFDAMMAKRHDRMEQHEGHDGPPPPPPAA